MLLGVQLYRPFARRLEGRYSLYGVYSGRELVMLESPDKAPSVPELASDYVEIIRHHQPTGPYRIGGISFGGIVAYEVAQQRASGADVVFVGMIDAVLPESGMRYRMGQIARLFSLPFRDILHVLKNRIQRCLDSLTGLRQKSEFTRQSAQKFFFFGKAFSYVLLKVDIHLNYVYSIRV